MSEHFSKIVNTPPTIPTTMTNFLPSQSPPLTVTEEEVYYELGFLEDPHKRNSPTAIPTKILKECALELCYVISHILNKSYECGQVPEMWKTGFITPVPKVPHVLTLGQLRPITVTSNMAKLSETFILKRILPSVENKISLNQYGAFKESSTSHYLVKLLDFALKSMDKKTTPIIFTCFDREKAFNLIDHNILLNKLHDIGISGAIIAWISEGNHSVIIFVVSRIQRQRKSFRHHLRRKSNSTTKEIIPSSSSS